MPRLNVKHALVATSILLLQGCALLSPAPSLVSELTFTDANFAQCVKQTGQDTLANISKLSCTNKKIINADEVRHMQNLTELNLFGNQVATIDVTNLLKLTSLNLGNNDIANIDLSANSELNFLNIQANKLTSIDVSQNPKLASLYLSKMPIDALDVSKNIALTKLGLSRHKLTSLDVSQNTALTSLNLVRGELSELDISQNTELTYLNVAINKLKTLDMGNNTKLVTIFIRDNQFSALDVSNNPELTSIRVDDNQLTTLDLHNNPALRNLNVESNQIEALDLSHQADLTTLVASDNPLQKIEFSEHAEITKLLVADTPYAKAVQQEQSGKVTDIPQVTIGTAGLITVKAGKFNIFGTQMPMPELGQSIGFRYAVSLPENASLNLKGQHILPITMRMIHPELTDPKTGRRFSESTWADKMYLHDQNLARWYFGEKYELVTGRWTLELLYKDQVLAKKSFKVVDVEAQTEELKAALLLLTSVQQGERILCAQAKTQTCLAFENKDQCISGLEPFAEKCQALALRYSKRHQKKLQTSQQFRQYFTAYSGCIMGEYARKSQFDMDELKSCLSE